MRSISSVIFPPLPATDYCVLQPWSRFVFIELVSHLICLGDAIFNLAVK